MASLYQRTQTKVNPATGKATKRKLPKWWGKYNDADGITQRVSLSTNKTAAQQMLTDLVKQAEFGKSGLIDPFQHHLKSPLTEHLAGFRQSLESKANTSEHVSLTLARVQTAFTGCGFQRLADLNADKVAHWLKTRREESEGRFGVATSNHHLVAIKSFGNWLVKAQRFPRNPFVHLSRLNAKVDVRVERRALAPAELMLLIEGTLASQEAFRGLTGEDRGMLYLVASTTGLRADELANLTPESFDLTATPPTVTIQAKNEKSRRGAVLPILPKVAERLDRWISSRSLRHSGNRKSPPVRLWPGTWSEKAAVMLRKDLQAARVSWTNQVEQNPEELTQRTESEFLMAESSSGQVVDFHALRHSFISMLATSGVHPKIAQQLARHSTITLTMDRYSHLQMNDLNQAVVSMPALLSSESQVLTGMEGPKNFTATKVCPPVCPADDFPCNALTIVDDNLHISFAEPNAKNPDEKLGSEAYSQVSTTEKQMKALGLEPRTYGLKVRCSTD